jgi:hypothetical protein
MYVCIYVCHVCMYVCMYVCIVIILFFLQIRKAAPEFYDSLSQHPSWPLVLWEFITDASVGPFSRVKRFPVLDPKAVPAASKSE